MSVSRSAAASEPAAAPYGHQSEESPANVTTANGFRRARPSAIQSRRRAARKIRMVAGQFSIRP